MGHAQYQPRSSCMEPDKPNRATDDLSSFLDMRDPQAVLAEVAHTSRLAYPGMDLSRIERALSDVVLLYKGEYPGWRECNTQYHDLKHTTDVFLATARLLHGLCLTGQGVSRGMAELALICALMHDAGYIQCEADIEGTGAKHTANHVERSADFMHDYMNGMRTFTEAEASSCANIIMSTKLSIRFSDIAYSSRDEEAGGRALFTADVLGQMADRIYLEKLLFLYREFSEAQVPGLEGEKSLLEKTVEFYSLIRERLVRDAMYSESVMRAHFKARWGMDEDFYSQGIDNNMSYLAEVLKKSHIVHYRSFLNREGMVNKLAQMEREERLASAMRMKKD